MPAPGWAWRRAGLRTGLGEAAAWAVEDALPELRSGERGEGLGRLVEGDAVGGGAGDELGQHGVCVRGGW